ncbi:PAS domain S-box protein [Pontiellaceae bacterium B12219]|nr:PAS domain S-box protein [Pontiellaceae bacterium B12219]
MHARHNPEHTSIKTHVRRPVLWTAILSTLLISITIYSLLTGSRLARKYAPLQNAAMEIKLEATLAHLWFEEIMSGDRYADISTVWKHVELSAWYARAMLEGGKNSEGTYTPLRDQALRHEIEEVQIKIGAYREIIEKRWAAQADSGIGSASDQQFDVVFEDLFSQADGVETALQTAMAKNLRQFHILQGFLIVLSLVFFAIMAIAIRYYTRQHVLGLSAIQENEKWLRLSTETAGVGIWEFDVLNNKMTRSQNHDQLYGLEPQEIWTVDSFLNAVHPDDRDFSAGLIEESIAAGGPERHHFDYRTIWPDKSIHWLSLTGKITERNSEGNATQMRGCLLDVTERKSAEKNLKASEERFRLICENSPVLIDSFDENGKCVLWNKHCEETFGWTLEEINAHPDSLELFYPDPVVRAEVTKTVTSDPDGHFKEWHPVTKDGRELTIIWANFRLPSGLIFSLGHDITQRKQEQAQLQLMSKALENSLNAFVIVSSDGEITYANHSYVKLWGYDCVEEIVGTSADGHCQDPALPEKIISILQTTGKFEGEITATKKDGSPFEVLMYACAAHDNEGQLIFPTTFIDITERKQLEEENKKSRAILQKAEELSHQGAWEWDILSDQWILSKNFLQIHGCSGSSISRDELMELAHPDDAQRIERSFQDALAGKAAYRLEHRIIRQNDKEVRVLHVLGEVIRDETGLPVRMRGVAQDITALKQAQQDVLKERNRLQFALEVSHMGAWDLDLVDLSSHRAPGHDHIFGYDNPLPEWTYEMFLEHVVPEDRADIDRQFQEALAHQSDWNFECRIRRPDGQLRWIRSVGRHGTPVDGTVRIMGGIVLDITERKQAEIELTHAHDLLEERVEERTAELEVRKNEAETLNRAMINVLGDLKQTNLELETAERSLLSTNKELEAFSYSVSHDLRAPLRHIDGFVGLLLKREKQLDATSARYLDTIAHASGRMGRLIDDLLAFSRTNRSKMRTERVDLNNVVQHTINDLSSLTEGRQITWKIGDLPLVQADGGLIRQVWENLIGNAVKYTGNREHARIEIGTTHEGSDAADELVFFIQDNGAGFDPQYIDKLFGVFQRLHREDEFEGTGIGLATVGRIIHRHGGRVWAEGAVDQGATFYFTLTAAQGAE